MKQKSFKKTVEKHLDEIISSNGYAWNDPLRRDTLLCSIALELAIIVDILERRSEDD